LEAQEFSFQATEGLSPPQIDAIRSPSLCYPNDCVICVCCWKLNCESST
jgi:hypothetical protein